MLFVQIQIRWGLGPAHLHVGKDLKSTQAYPLEFGHAWATLTDRFDDHMVRTGCALHERAIAAYVTSRRLTQRAHPTERWPDADLDGVFALLSGPLER